MKPWSIAAPLVCVLLVACGGGGGDISSDSGDVGGNADNTPVDPNVLPRNDIKQLSDLYPYVRDSQYASVLKRCALANSAAQSCSLGTLPFIGESNPQVEIDAIMQRVLVTHDWMGERFEALLYDAPNEMIELFASVTVISMGSTVRPSFYSTLTAAIQLDPAFIWLTQAEKANISIADDYRVDFGRDLGFWEMRSARLEGARASPYYSLTSRLDRTYDEMKLRAYTLLFHELGHAVDYVNPQYMSLVNTNDTPSQAIESLVAYRGSLELLSVSPLTSIEMEYLGLVQFRGYEATEQQKTYTPSQVGGFMSSDGAAKYYSYHTEREDFANLLELSMMKKHFNVDLYTGFASKPVDDTNYRCDELIVGWGQRNRLSDPLVWPRAKWVVENVYGLIDENTRFFDLQIDRQSAMTPGVDWCTNRDNERDGIASRASTQVRDSVGQLNAERQQRLH